MKYDQKIWEIEGPTPTRFENDGSLVPRCRFASDCDCVHPDPERLCWLMEAGAESIFKSQPVPELAILWADEEQAAANTVCPCMQLPNLDCKLEETEESRL